MNHVHVTFFLFMFSLLGKSYFDIFDFNIIESSFNPEYFTWTLIFANVSDCRNTGNFTTLWQRFLILILCCKRRTSEDISVKSESCLRPITGFFSYYCSCSRQTIIRAVVHCSCFPRYPSGVIRGQPILSVKVMWHVFLVCSINSFPSLKKQKL